MTWNKIFGFFVGSLGTCFSLSVILFVSSGKITNNDAYKMMNASIIITGMLTAILSIFVYKGIAWSHTILCAVTVFVLIIFVGLSILDFRLEGATIQRIFGALFFYASMLLVPGFFLTVLRHPDVKRDFNK